MITIQCAICSENISFDLNNPSTFLSVRESGNPFIGKLFTVRVAHSVSDTLKHVNVVVLDANNVYRAHKDSYEEKEKLGETIELWEKATQSFPQELRPFLSLAKTEEKNLFISSSLPSEEDITGWKNLLIDLWAKNTSNNLISFLAAKFLFIIGQDLELIKKYKDETLWSYPIFLRYTSRTSPSKELHLLAQNLKVDSVPIAIGLEFSLAKAEVFVRLGSYKDLETLYTQILEQWEKDSSPDSKRFLMIIQSYYGFSLYRQGKVNESLDLLKPAFLFAQLIEDRELISIIGPLYGNILRAKGDLTAAFNTYNIVLEVSKLLGDERNQIVISINMGIIETTQGSLETALNRMLRNLDTQIAQKDFQLKTTLLINIADLYNKMKKDEECKKYAMEALATPNLIPEMRLALLSALRNVVLRTRSKELLDFINEQLSVSDFSDNLRGQIFQFSIDAISAELENDWEKAILYYQQQLEIMKANAIREEINEVEIKIAEAYIMLYHSSSNSHYLTQAYNHLDLAKTVAMEANYFIDLCHIDITKSAISLALGMKKRAQTLLNEALTVAVKHNFRDLVKEIRESLDDLDQPVKKEKALERLQNLFNTMKGSKKIEPSKRSKDFTLHSLWLKSSSLSWEIIFKPTSEEELSVVDYLKGFRDFWLYIGKIMDNKGLSMFTTNRGTIMMEKSDNFQLIVLCNSFDYITRTQFQDLLAQLETFPLKHISEELSEHCLTKISELFGEGKVFYI